MTDLELVERVKSGDLDAIEEFHSRYFIGASRYVHVRFGLAPGDAESLVNGAIFKAIEKIHTFEGKASEGMKGVKEEKGSLNWWVLAIVKNEAKDQHRKKFHVIVKKKKRLKAVKENLDQEEKSSEDKEKEWTPRDALDDPRIQSYDDASFNEPVASAGYDQGGPEYGDEIKLTKKQLRAKKALDSLTPSQRSILLMRLEKSDKEIADQEFVTESTIRSRYNRAKKALENAYDEASEEEE